METNTTLKIQLNKIMRFTFITSLLMVFALGVSAQATVSTIAGNGTTGNPNANGAFLSSQFDEPFATAIDPDGNIIIGDHSYDIGAPGGPNNTLRKLDLATGLVTTLNSAGGGWLDGPLSGAKFDGISEIKLMPDGTGYIIERDGHKMRKVDPSGIVSTLTATGWAVAPPSFYDIENGECFAINAAGEIFIGSGGFGGISRIHKVDVSGIPTVFSGGGGGYVDGPIASAQYHRITGMEFDASGDLYLVEFGNHTLRKIDFTTMTTSTVLGGSAGDVDGPAATALITSPNDLAQDASGRLYLTSSSLKIKMYDPTTNELITVAGTGVVGTTDGPALSATFNGIGKMAFDASGALYLGDASNQLVRKITGLAAACDFTTCANMELNFTPDSTDPGNTYAWDFGDGTTSTDEAPTHTYTAAGNYTLTLSITDVNGCVSISTQNVCVTPALIVAVDNDGNVCSGEVSAVVTATVSGGTAPYTYAWIPTGATTSAVAGVAAGTHDVTVTDVNGCTADGSTTVGTFPGTPSTFTISH